MSGKLTWAELKQEVDKFLNADSDIQSEAGSNFKDQVVRAAAIDLQRQIKRYRAWHETVIPNTDLIPDTEAHMLDLPEGKIHDFYITDSETATDPKPCNRFVLDQVDWNRRQQLICGTICPPYKRAVYTLNPFNRQTCYVFPKVEDDQVIVIHWTGIKQKWNDPEKTVFDVDAAEAIYLYAKSKIMADPDENIAGGGEFYNMYRLKRAELKATVNY